MGRILVTGGAGFVGSGFVHHVIAEADHDVVQPYIKLLGLRLSSRTGEVGSVRLERSDPQPQRIAHH